MTDAHPMDSAAAQQQLVDATDVAMRDASPDAHLDRMIAAVVNGAPPAMIEPGRPGTYAFDVADAMQLQSLTAQQRYIVEGQRRDRIAQLRQTGSSAQQLDNARVLGAVALRLWKATQR